MKYYHHKKTDQVVWVKPGSAEENLARILKRREDGPMGANLQLYQLPSKWTELDIYMHFAHFGEITSLWLDRDLFTGKSNRIAHLSFSNIKDALTAKTVMSSYETEKDGTKGKLSIHVRKGEEKAMQQFQQEEHARQMERLPGLVDASMSGGTTFPIVGQSIAEIAGEAPAIPIGAM
jgi:hypothetical protein